MTVLKYADLYRLSEELQGLCGAQVQGVYHPNALRYVLELRLPGETRLLIFDLTPAQPFIVSTSFTKTKTQSSRTPIHNFLNAHFVNHRIDSIEIAEKPNRTLKITFGERTRELYFKCFPHGQHLLLKSDQKIVNFPLRPPNPEDEKLSYVEPENAHSWTFNDDWAERVLKLKATPSFQKAHLPYHEKLILKLQKAKLALTEGMKTQRPLDEEKIKLLESEAQRLSLESKSGNEIQALYAEIKKIQRKGEVGLQRLADIEEQIEKLQREKPTEPAASPISNQNKKGRESFSGTRVRISEKWELWVGRTAWQNNDLLREASPHDLWIHLRDYPGAHGVLRGPKKSEPTLGQIETAACIVAILSQSKKSPFNEGEKLDFIITPKKFVKKRKGDLPGRVTVERETVQRIAFKIIKFEVI